MSVLLEALKKAALEKRHRDESAASEGAGPPGDHPATDSSPDNQSDLTDAGQEPLEQKPVVNPAATGYLARQEARRSSPIIEAPEDEEPSARYEEPSARYEEPSARYEEPPARYEEPSALDDTSPADAAATDSDGDSLPVDDFALPEDALEDAPSVAALNADEEDDLDLDIHEPAEEAFEAATELAADEPQTEEPAASVDAAEQRRALQQLMARSRDVLKQRKRRGAYMYAALIFTSLGAIGLYYYALSSDGGLLIPEPAIESAEVFSEPVTPAVEPVVATVPAEESTSTIQPVEVVSPAALAVNTEAPESPFPVATETLANREPVALVEPVGTAMSASREPAFQSESRVLIERRQTPRPLARKVNDAYRAYQAGDIDRASTLYREVLEESPRQRDALLGIAAIAVQRGQYQEALRYYQRRLVDDSGDHFARAGLLALAGQGVADPELQSEVKMLLDDYPQQAHLHFLLGSLQAAAGSWAEAQRSFFEARSWDRENPDYAYNLAVSLEHLRQPRQALSQYRDALELARATPPQFDIEVASRRVAYLEQRP